VNLRVCSRLRPANREWATQEASGDRAAPEGRINSVLESKAFPRPSSLAQFPELSRNFIVAKSRFQGRRRQDDDFSFGRSLDAEVRIELAEIEELVIRHRRRMQDHRRLRFHVIQYELHSLVRKPRLLQCNNRLGTGSEAVHGGCLNVFGICDGNRSLTVTAR
jgi:hypothetical protein